MERERDGIGGCLTIILYYLIPVAIVFLFDLSISDVVILGLSSLIGLAVASKIADALSIKSVLAYFAVALLVFFLSAFLIYSAIYLIKGDDAPDSHSSAPVSTSRTTTASPVPQSSTYSRSNLANYYRNEFPQVWGWIVKYADDPYSYIIFYDRIWGDLQEYHGDGMPFHTLTYYEQSLVHYPARGQYIWMASGSTTYHNTPDCYTLLRSKQIIRYPYAARIHYYPCSKCVGE